jgi:hypothetical protein
MIARLLPAAFTSALACAATAQAWTQFQNGTVADATQVNANFTLVAGKADGAVTAAQAAATAASAAQGAAAAAQTTADNAFGSAAQANSSLFTLAGDVNVLSASLLGLTNFLAPTSGGLVNSGVTFVGNDLAAVYRGTVGRFANATGWAPGRTASGVSPGLFVEWGDAGPGVSPESGGFFANDDTAAIWSAGDGNLLNIYDEDDLDASTTAPPPKSFLNGAGTWFAAGYQTISDARFKANVRPIERALDKVMALHGRVYDLRADELCRGDVALGKPVDAAALRDKVGFIAQDLQQVLPEVVGYNADWNCLTVNYDGVVPVLVEAIKEQQRQIAELRGQVDALQRRATR